MEKIIEIAQTIEKNGGRLYLVGGAIRDKICNIPVHDEDYCVTYISKEKFEKLFPYAKKRGKAFCVYEIDGREFALARVEQKNGIGHKNFDMNYENISIKEDLQRRDITINAIAQDVLTNEIIDPFGGIEDLKSHIIKAVSPHFADDPLRAYRVSRFASTFDFKVDLNTIKMMNSLKGELKFLSPERVFEEFKKAINSDYPERFFETLKEADILYVHFIEIYKLIGSIQPVKYHPEGDSYNHTMLALKRAASITKNEKIRFAALVHDFGKGLTDPSEYPHHTDHDIKGVNEVQKLGERLKLPNSWIDYGKTAAKEHMKGGIFNQMTPNKQVDFIERIEKTNIGLNGLEIVVESDRNCRGTKLDKIEFAELGNELISKINGKIIMEKYGIPEGIKLKERIHEERIKYLKNLKKL